MKNLLLVFIGGGFGSVLRYVFGKFLNSSQSGFPYGTFAANILGSLLIGVILGYAVKNNSLTQGQTLFLATGFCGGFTTFSTFSKTGDFTNFALYTIASFIIGFLAVFLGIFLSK